MFHLKIESALYIIIYLLKLLSNLFSSFHSKGEDMTHNMYSKQLSWKCLLFVHVFSPLSLTRELIQYLAIWPQANFFYSHLAFCKLIPIIIFHEFQEKHLKLCNQKNSDCFFFCSLITSILPNYINLKIRLTLSASSILC